MKEDYLARGFQKIHDDLDFLLTCFREVLEEFWLRASPGYRYGKKNLREPVEDVASVMGKLSDFNDPARLDQVVNLRASSPFLDRADERGNQHFERRTQHHGIACQIISFG